MLNPSWEDTSTVEQFFITGRSRWHDLPELRKNLQIDRSLIPDDMVQFLRSTCLNEYGIAHYVKGYYRSYGDDYKLSIWATLWGGEEFLHHVILRICLKAMGEEISEHEFAGLEHNDYHEHYDSYLDSIKVSPQLSPRLLQLIYNVLQEYSAYVAYTSVSEKIAEPQLASILKRMGQDELRHCSFFQLTLKEYVKHADAEEVEFIWPQFRNLWNNLHMPQEHIDLFQEEGYATDLYVDFWSSAWRSKMAVELTHYFKQFRTPIAA